MKSRPAITEEEQAMKTMMQHAFQASWEEPKNDVEDLKRPPRTSQKITKAVIENTFKCS